MSGLSLDRHPYVGEDKGNLIRPSAIIAGTDASWATIYEPTPSGTPASPIISTVWYDPADHAKYWPQEFAPTWGINLSPIFNHVRTWYEYPPEQMITSTNTVAKIELLDSNGVVLGVAEQVDFSNRVSHAVNPPPTDYRDTRTARPMTMMGGGIGHVSGVRFTRSWSGGVFGIIGIGASMTDSHVDMDPPGGWVHNVSPGTLHAVDGRYWGGYTIQCHSTTTTHQQDCTFYATFTVPAGVQQSLVLSNMHVETVNFNNVPSHLPFFKVAVNGGTLFEINPCPPDMIFSDPGYHEVALAPGDNTITGELHARDGGGDPHALMQYFIGCHATTAPLLRPCMGPSRLAIWAGTPWIEEARP